jgi:uncharacterized RDD family membrane protein YckC
VKAPAGQVSGYYAGAFTRLAAFAIDWFIMVAVYGLIVAFARWLLSTFFGVDMEVSWETGLVGLLGFLAWGFVYMVVGLTVSGRTIGKTLLGLKVVTRQGAPLGVGRASGRTVVMPLSFALLGLGLLGIVLGRERRALHDVIAGTAVVYDWGDRPAEMPAPLTRWLESRGVAILSSPDGSPEPPVEQETTRATEVRPPGL